MTIRAGLFLLLLLLFLVQFCEASFASIYSSVSGVCKKRNLEDSVLIEDNQCSSDDIYLVHRNFPSSFGVSETNGTTLERSLRILQTKETMYAAVLVYAKWCPFSRELRPVFETLSSVFPSIYHFSVEESALQPSGFSYYGVHSFPALFLHNKTARVRYHGSRTIEALSEFYKEFTGLQPLDLNKRVTNLEIASKGDLSTKTFIESRGFHDDMFLSLSVVFLTLRAFFHILPKLFGICKKYWTRKGASRRVHRNLLERVVFRRFEQEKTANGSTRRAKGKSPRKDLTQETGKVLLSVPGWSSSSLAAVALAEGSSSRGGTKEDM